MRLRHHFNLEELGERIMPSSLPFSLPGLLGPPAHHVLLQPAPAFVQQHTLAGQGSGTFAGADAGARYSLQGTVDLGGLGHATVQGTIHGPGGI